MSSTGVCRFIAAFASCVIAQGACPPGNLTPDQILTRVRDLDRAAQADIEQRRFSDAVHKLKDAACLAPDSSRVFYGLGMAQAADGDFTAARDSFRKSGRLQPNSKLPLVMQVRVNFALHDIDSLKANLRDAAARFPHDAEMHSVLARFLSENKLYELGLAESLRSRTGSDPTAQVELAGLENTVGAFDDAIRNGASVTQNSAAPKPVRAAAAGIAGLSYESLGQHKEAVAFLQQAIQLDPAHENSYLALADILGNAQQPNDAIKILEQGRRVLPNLTAFLLPLGVNMVRAERYKDAIPVLRDAIQAAPDDDQGYLNIAAACRHSGDTTGEIQILKDLQQRIPKQPMIHVLLARALLNGDPVDYAQVNSELALAEQANPNDADLFYLRGKVALALNDLPNAKAAFERSIELRPMDQSAYYQLGRLYQKLGQSERAKENLERAVMLANGGARQQ